MLSLVPNIVGVVYGVFQLFFFIWAFIIFFDAKNRGYSFFKSLLWAVGSFFLFFIVIPVWYWTRPNFSAAGKEDLCPSCKEIYKGSPAVCSHCGYMFQGEVVDLSNIE